MRGWLFPLLPIKRRIKQDTLQVPQIEHNGVLSTDGRFESIIGSDILGPGLMTDIGEYDSFLNVIVQTLWHLRAFREEFMSRSTSEHVHIGDPCVCELQEIFIALSVASANNEREAISSTPLRNALIKLDPDSNYFQEAHSYDASKILRTILDCLHASFTSCPVVSDAIQSPERKYAASSWGCGSDASIAHKHFGKDILEKMVCSNCGMESVERQYTSWMYGIHAISLRTIKACLTRSFSVIAKYVCM
ncbi:hypothetical protein Vadar_022953 [Vaccinium darrowii]|uniref:Uncharacterized protein n=1 Tax=Vaccinium darrowii TaxID=229202 RepID=A0ACB7X3Q1_9ERIC|nr:hypothetical protein Vadar_022953 [Vaccinium darrowii]